MFVPPGFASKSVVTQLGTIVYYTASGFPWVKPESTVESTPSLVFLHGFGGGSSAYEWSKVYPAFAAEYRILAPDLIGWGRSDHPVRNYQVDDYINTLIEFLEQTSSAAVSVVASSLTAAITIRAAIAHHDAGTARVIPIILRPCDWNHEYVPFSKLNVLPTHAQPMTKWEDPDEAFTIVAQKIRETVEQLIAEKQAKQQAAEQERRQAEAAAQQRRAAAQRQQTAQTQLASERGVDYSRLRDLLKAGQWKEADQETADRMCEVMGRQAEGRLRSEDIENFPCTDLRTIDHLWVTHSQGKFGFSVQKKIWQECGSPTKYNSDWEKFGDRVGCRKAGNWLAYSNLNPSLFSPPKEIFQG